MNIRKMSWGLLLSCISILLLLTACSVDGSPAAQPTETLPGSSSGISESDSASSIPTGSVSPIPQKEMDDTIGALITSPEFSALPQDKRAEQVSAELEKLGEQGIIAADTVSYEEATGLFTFRYANGLQGVIRIKEYSEEYNGVGDIAAAIQTECFPVLTRTVSSNASESVDSISDLHALVLNGFEATSDRRDYYTALEREWENLGLDTTVDTYVTLSDFCSLNDYQIVIFAMHGSHINGEAYIVPNETISNLSVYAEEISSGRVVAEQAMSGWDLLVPADFFSYHSPTMTTELIFSECCAFFGCDCSSGLNTDYADTLVSCGVETVIGYHNSVEASYSRDIMKLTVEAMLRGDTAQNALNTAISSRGENDGYESISIDKYIATPQLAGDAEGTLFFVTAEDLTLPDEFVLTVGETNLITPTVTPANADYTISWKAADTSIVTCSPTGERCILQGCSKGTTELTATLTSGSKNIEKKMSVRVASKARDSVLVLDISGSMGGTPLEELKQSAEKFCRDLLKDEYNNRVGLVFYATDVELTVDLTNDLEYLIRVIQGVDCTGLTNMYDALATADDMLRKNSREGSVKNVIIMADGLPNEGPTSNSGWMEKAGQFPDPWADAVIDCAKTMTDYNVYSLGYFHSLMGPELEFGKTLMRMLTNQPDGYHEVVEAENLQFAFGDIQEEITRGAKIVINIACPVSVRVKHGKEMLSSVSGEFNDIASFGTLQLLGETKDIKVLSLDADKEYDIEILGDGYGTMDYSAMYYDETETLVDSRAYPTVPITTRTRIRTEARTTEEDIEMKVDQDGDGEIDLIYTAKKLGEATVTYGEVSRPVPVPEVESEPEPQPIEDSSQTLAVTIGLVFVVLLVMGLCTALVISSNMRVNEEDDPGIPIIAQNKKETETEPIRQAPETDNIAEEYGSIIINSGEMMGDVIPIHDREIIKIGRSPSASNLVLTGYRYVSGLHCAVEYNAEKKLYYITDVSANGTYYSNRQRMAKNQRVAIQAGSRILLANSECAITLK